MKNYLYPVKLAGIPLTLKTGYPIPPFDDFRTDEAGGPVIEAPSDAVVQQETAPGEKGAPVREYLSFVPPVSHALLPYDRCVFHGAAFVWRDKAWIFTAPAGTGKTTQYIRWKERYGSEIAILNGDKPILEWRDDGSVWVHPSPWRGKENMGRMLSAPLGGVIYLRQGPENRIDSLSNTGVISALLYRQFMFSPKDAQDAMKVCELTERLIRSVPVWRLTNLGDAASAELMYDTILKWEEKK